MFESDPNMAPGSQATNFGLSCLPLRKYENEAESGPICPTWGKLGHTRFLKNTGPYGSHSTLLLKCLEATGKCYLSMGIIHVNDFI